MAMFFHDDAHIECPGCGCTLMYSRTSGNYEQDKKDKMTLIFTPINTEIVCSNCGRVVKKLGAFEKIRGENIGNA
jgi:ribosomal protein S27E